MGIRTVTESAPAGYRIEAEVNEQGLVELFGNDGITRAEIATISKDSAHALARAIFKLIEVGERDDLDQEPKR